MKILNATNLSKTYSYQNKIGISKIALKNITFSIKKGQRIGIIGKNGSGKSTLLKIISGIIKPSSGSVEVNGSINAILELGDNFINDLTGKENAILFFKLKGIKGKLIEEFVVKAGEFSELGDYFYEPIKNYSSGMKLRLGIAVCLLVKGDLMLIDEVFSAGDAAFKIKISKTLQEIISKNLSLLMVSHVPEEVLLFCTDCIWMEDGEIRKIGKAKEVIEEYYYEIAKEKSEKNFNLSETIILDEKFGVKKFHPIENDLVKVTDFTINSLNQDNRITFDKSIIFNIKFLKKIKNLTLHAQLIIYDYQMNPILMITQHHNSDSDLKVRALQDYSGLINYKVILPAFQLTFGNYYIDFGLGKNINPESIHNENAIQSPFKIHFLVEKGNTRDWTGANEQVFVKPMCEWEITALNREEA
jgi:ABC-2 type transport system ATP-binding protein